MLPVFLGLLAFVIMMLVGGSLGRAWFDYRLPLRDKSAAWRALVGWPAAKTVVIATLAWFLINWSFDSATAWQAVGLAVAGWVVAVVVLAAFDATPSDD